MKEVTQPKDSPSRDLTIDVVRGIAIFTMVGANMAPFLAEPHSTLMRYYSSFAAPIFVTLAGTMIAFGVYAKPESHGVMYMVKRGLFLIAVAAFIDVVAWNYLPFIGMDVLYLIGLILPLLFVMASLSQTVIIAASLLVFGLTPALQYLLGYAEIPMTPSLGAIWGISALDLGAIAKHWIVDGWFPIFPWLGYGLIGVAIGQWRWRSRQLADDSRMRSTLLSAFLIALGSISMIYFGGPLYSRAGYSELFYPATLGFIALSIGVVVALILLVDQTIKLSFWEYLRPLGEASLFMYLVHSLAIGLVLMPFWKEMTLPTYLSVYGVMMFFLMACGLALRSARKKYKKVPVMVKWVIGG